MEAKLCRVQDPQDISEIKHLKLIVVLKKEVILSMFQICMHISPLFVSPKRLPHFSPSFVILK